MATVRWIGRAAKVAKVIRIEPTAVNSTVYTVGIPDVTNGATITYTSDASATVQEIAEGLQAAAAASEDPRFLEVTWTEDDTYLYGTAATAGMDFTVAVGANLTLTTPTANVSPNDLANVKNWDGGSLPANSDTVIFDAGDVDVLYNLDGLAARTGITFERRKGYIGHLRLPEYNESGYTEYRATELQFDGGTFLIEQSSTDDVEHIKINSGSTAATLTVIGEGGGTLDQELMRWRNTHATTTVNVERGSVAIAPIRGTTAVVATLRCQESVVRGGAGVTYGTAIYNHNSTMQVESNLPATYVQTGSGASLTTRGTTTMSSPSLQDGVCIVQSTGTITTPTIGTDATIDFSTDNRARSISGTVTLHNGATYNDPASTTFGSEVTFAVTACTLDDVNIIIGPGRTVKVS